MVNFSNFSPTQPAKPKPRVKKGNHDIAKVVREAAHAGDENFAYFVANGKLRTNQKIQ
jgi:hypothetical protein